VGGYMNEAAEDFDTYDDTGEVQVRLFPKEPSAIKPTELNGAEPVKQGLAHTHVAGAITELRAIKQNPHSILLGHYTDINLLFEYASELNRQGYATYACINPLRSDCVTGLNGDPKEGAAAGDKHIADLRYLVYDVDPMRRDAVGKPLVGADGTKIKCAATDAEKKLARTVAMSVYDFYLAMGVSPVLIDSGNGFYVLVPISLKPEESYLCAALLACHAADFDLPGGAEIDESCSNPSRILRVPGTKNCKGKEMPDRPHRMCKVLIPGNRNRVLTAAELQALVPTATAPKTEPLAAGGVDLEALWMECFLDYCEILHGPRELANGGGYMWLLEKDMDYCPNYEEHGDPDQPTTLAVFVLPSGKFGMRCHHGHCSKIDPKTGHNKIK
jgi:hypothetical protein